MTEKTEILNVRISAKQKQTLGKLKEYNVNVSQFIRIAIKEKLEREYSQIISKYNESKRETLPF